MLDVGGQPVTVRYVPKHRRCTRERHHVWGRRRGMYGLAECLMCGRAELFSDVRRTDPDRATVRLVRDRDDWRCARCAGPGPLSTQHRVARQMGGTRWSGINLPGNLLTVCGSGTTLCHGWIEHHPTHAEAHGWSVRRAGNLEPDPAHEPVWTWRGWVLLLDTGEVWQLDNHPGADGCACGCRPTETPAGLWEPATIEETPWRL